MAALLRVPCQGNSCHRQEAALAVVEAYGLTGNRELKESAQRALTYVELMQNPWFACRRTSGSVPRDP